MTEGGTFGGFGPPTISQPNGAGTFPLVITRTDRSDGSLELKQTFTRNAAEKALTIQMTVTNRFGATMARVSLARYFDGDVGATSQNVYDHTEDSVWARHPDSPRRGLMLTRLSFTTPGEAFVERFGDWDPLGSGSQTARQAGARTPVAVPTAVGDFVGRLSFELVDLKPGQSRTVRVQYRSTY